VVVEEREDDDVDPAKAVDEAEDNEAVAVRGTRICAEVYEKGVMRRRIASQSVEN
jgi:hypothetical protein